MKRLVKALFLLPFILLASGWASLKLPVFGASQGDVNHQRFSSSSQYDVTRHKFHNRRANLVSEMRENGSIVRMLQEFLEERPDGKPTEPLPEAAPDLDQFIATTSTVLPSNTDTTQERPVGHDDTPERSTEDDATQANVTTDSASSARAIWLGHSTFLIRMASKTILVDPIFGKYASPVSFVGARFQPPVIALEQLPPIDIVLISHDHYDHLDMPSIRHFAASSTLFLAPLGVGTHLRRWGIVANNIVEKDWWESYTIDKLDFTATPAQHFSGRTGFDTDATLWASWVIASDDTRLYFSGDSGYDTHFKEIGERLGPFDVAFLENGQYDEKWRAVHMLPDETAQAFEDLRAHYLFPIHWGMFELAFHTWYDPIVALAKEADVRGIELMTPLIGEVVALDGSDINERWWEPVVTALDEP